MPKLTEGREIEVSERMLKAGRTVWQASSVWPQGEIWSSFEDQVLADLYRAMFRLSSGFQVTPYPNPIPARIAGAVNQPDSNLSDRLDDCKHNCAAGQP